MEAVYFPTLLPARRLTTVLPQKPLKHSAFPSDLQEDILHVVYRYHYVLLKQFCRLLGFQQTSRGWLQREYIKPLVKAGYLYEQCLSRKRRVGSLPSVYSLATKGRNHLERLGYSVYTRPTPSEQEKSAGFLYHCLELNEVLIYPHLFSRTYQSVYLADWRHDLDMQHQRSQLPPLHGKKRFLVPDGFVDFSLLGDRRKSFLIELDRGTINTVYRFQERIRDYCDFISYGSYQRDFGSDSLTILWVTTAGSRRVEQLRKWTKAELTRLAKKEHMKYHRFLAVPTLFEGSLHPSTFFCDPIWKTLQDETKVRLLELL